MKSTKQKAKKFSAVGCMIFMMYLANDIRSQALRQRQKQIRFHDFRHTYASLLISKDFNFKYIQKQMGHSSFEVTMNTYAHLMPEVYEKSKLAIDNLI